MSKENIKKLTITAMFLALGFVLPFFTGQVPRIGNMLLPMHIPVLLCALICGWNWATYMAFILPLMRSLIFGMPPFYPTAVAMAFELATYAFVAGFIYAKRRNILTVYISLITAMFAGRVVWGCVQVILLGFTEKHFTFTAFVAGAFTNAFIGIIIQLVLIPGIMILLDKINLLPFDERTE